jgi:lysophospholipase L1-like esterase
MKRVRLLVSVSLWVSAVLSIFFAPFTPAAASPPTPGTKISPRLAGWPISIAATGDSITRAYNTGSVPFTDAPANSWSTGTNSSVNSHYTRILAVNPGISGHSFNDAVTGAKMTDLNGQIATVNSKHVDYLTILLGANDACRPTEDQMTPVDTFRSQFQAAMDSLSSGSPDTRVYVLSVPNVYNLWSILHDNSSARSTWALFGICQSMLVNPQSTAQADIDRRNRVRQRVVDFNTQLAQVCASYIHCKFDNNAVFNTNFAPGDVSTRDYFHPSISGQALIAANTFTAGFDFTDNVPPATWSASAQQVPPPPDPVPQYVVIMASDNVAVSGIEYRIDSGPITRYVGVAVELQPGSVLLYRAVDVNGNFGVWNSFGP